MIEANNKMFAEGNSTERGKKKVSFYYSIIKDLNLLDKPQALKNIENFLITELKTNYSAFLFKYNNLFSKVITENERKLFGSRLTNPNNLYLFEDPNQALKTSNTDPDQIFNKYKSNNPEEIVEKMLEETNFISAQYIKLWHCYIDLFKISPRFSIAFL